MNGTIIYTLLTIQFVCYFVMPCNSSINNTDSDAIQPTSMTRVPSLPAGYVAYPEFGAAYKVYNDSVTWYVAIEKCAWDRARLAIVDSAAKAQAVWNHGEPSTYGHVGISQTSNDEMWYNIYTSSSVRQSNIPWASGEPYGGGRCALLKNDGLMKFSCTYAAKPICEIPYP